MPPGDPPGSDAPERLDRFMARANAAYYATHDPFADFTTAPEIGQAFGELLGAWAAVIWDQLGRPDPLALAEAGPGRGTLMADALRVTGRVTRAFHGALRVHFIETSPRLRAIQARAVPGAVWHDGLDTLPETPLILLANEFLDALPVRQFIRRKGGWMERYVLSGNFVERPCAPLGCDAPPGTVVEISEAAQRAVARVAAGIRDFGGAALWLDYGAAGGTGDSLQALRNGRPADPLHRPGEADLTAHVDFSAVRRVAEAAGAVLHGPVTQGDFLGRLGLASRTEALARANPERAAVLREASARLAAPDRMGALFKVACVTRAGAPVPPGFES